jgi:menaquinone-specific isochorismate synthase
MALNLPELLAAQDLFPKFYLRCKTSCEERAAIGSLQTYDFLPEKSDKTFYGALGFSPKDPSFFFLPQWEIIQTSKDTQVTCHEKNTPLKKPVPLTGDLSLTLLQTYPDKKGWDQSVAFTLEQIRQKSLEKAVLARKTTFTCNPKTNPFCFVKKLIEQNPSSTIFALQTSPFSLFLGATPERLYTREQNTLKTEAIAGTRKRGKTLEEDTFLEQELFFATKENKEFSLVEDFLIKALAPFCLNLQIEPKSIIKTTTLQHLYRSFSAKLLPGILDYQLIRALHPTPAVGGTPSCKAKKLLLDLEPCSRGFYAGPIGWSCKEKASFHVAIRSAFIEQNYLHAFSGAGIVEGSCPDAEWQELNHKLSHWTL